MTPIESWFKIDGDNTLRLDYPLNSKSYVVDLGGYRGNWSAKIADKYDCKIDIYEPVWEFYNICKIRFEDNKKIKVLPYGIGKESTREQIYLSEDGSSLYKGSGKKEIIQIKDAKTGLKSPIDLLKINVEGSEYDILERLIETKKVDKIKNIQVQFHPWVENYLNRYEKIREELSKTHKLTYEFPFVWENWERK